MSEDQLLEFLQSQGYRELRRIDGVLCGTLDYVTTRGLCVGLDALSCERRYCYQHRAEADAALEAYSDPSGHPLGNWIKVKGKFRGEYIDAFNPNWLDLEPWDKVAPQ